MSHMLWSVILGFLAGAIAHFIIHAHMGFTMTTLLGILRSIVGGLIARNFSVKSDTWRDTEEYMPQVERYSARLLYCWLARLSQVLGLEFLLGYRRISGRRLR
jgi:uncharacterized membrane protein YeaQ/YmgE (transglycosylase-associated protein family)